MANAWRRFSKAELEEFERRTISGELISTRHPSREILDKIRKEHAEANISDSSKDYAKV